MTLSHDHYTVLIAGRAFQLSADLQVYDNTYMPYITIVH